MSRMRTRLAGTALAALLIAPGALQAGHGRAAASHAHATTCVAGAGDGKGGPYPAKKSAICTSLKVVNVNIINDTQLPGAFAPSNITIKVGTKVVWHWQSTPHNLMPWHPGVISTTGATYARTFTKAGAYKYMCSLHPGMFGVVHVVK
jgi:plastocyanin